MPAVDDGRLLKRIAEPQCVLDFSVHYSPIMFNFEQLPYGCRE